MGFLVVDGSLAEATPMNSNAFMNTNNGEMNFIRELPVDLKGGSYHNLVKYRSETRP